VRAVGAERNGSLGAPELGPFGSRHPANRTAAIPLRHAPTSRGAQDDDAKHEPVSWKFRRFGNQSTFNKNAAKVDTRTATIP
jgi:hypothetical protein